MIFLYQWWLVGLVLVSPVFPSVLQGGAVPTAAAPADVSLRTPAPLPVKQASAISPVVGAKSALVVDLPSNTTLYNKDADTERPIASISKLMTVLLVTERTSGSEVVTVPDNLEGGGVEESRLGLRPGDQLRVDDLLAGTLIASANDAANLLARQVAGSEDQFVAAMNQRAQNLGLQHTRFFNPSGYGKGENYSTARDLAVISRAVVAQPRVRQWVSLKETVILPVKGDPYPVKNTDELLGGYLPIAGLKTGTSDAAGPCLVSLLSSGDRQLLAVVLNSPSRFQENKAMLDWTLRSYRW